VIWISGSRAHFRALRIYRYEDSAEACRVQVVSCECREVGCRNMRHLSVLGARR
jgi:hypothetical protein